MSRQEREGKGYKLSDKQQVFVCICLACGHSPERVAQDLKDEYGIVISRNNIRQNYQNSAKWKTKIEKMAEAFNREILKHPLASKVNRLNWLQEALNEALTWRVEKIYFGKDGNEIGRIMRKNISVVASLIREARAEVEGDHGVEISNPVHIYLPRKDPIPDRAS